MYMRAPHARAVIVCCVCARERDRKQKALSFALSTSSSSVYMYLSRAMRRRPSSLRDDGVVRRADPAVVVAQPVFVCSRHAREIPTSLFTVPELTASYTPGDITRIINSSSLRLSPRERTDGRPDGRTRAQFAPSRRDETRPDDGETVLHRSPTRKFARRKFSRFFAEIFPNFGEFQLENCHTSTRS